MVYLSFYISIHPSIHLLLYLLREVRFLVHQSIAGGIIGKGGEKIKEIRQESDCNVKVASDCCPMSTDRVVQVNMLLDYSLIQSSFFLSIDQSQDFKISSVYKNQCRVLPLFPFLIFGSWLKISTILSFFSIYLYYTIFVLVLLILHFRFMVHWIKYWQPAS